MIQKFYESFLLKHPIKILIAVSIVLALFFIGTMKLEIDASSNSIMLEDDADLKFSNEVTEKFKTQSILVIAYTPKNPLLSKETLKSIEKISKELVSLNKITSITSILNVPLLQSSPQSIKEVINNIPTIESSTLDLKTVKQEFLQSPIYKNNLVSKDFKTTAIILNLEEDKILSNNPKEKKIQRDKLREQNHLFINQVRRVLKQNKDSGKLFLGGVNMISDDLIGFVKDDLMIFGSSLLILLIIILWIIFREIRWIVLPVVICLASVIMTSGLLGFFDWEVTVISSNFISLQLIITISIVLHLIVRYKELVQKNPTASQKELVLETMLSKLSPSFFAILTTIVGFASLIFSNILPIINLGWMMSSGIAISLFLSFIIFPAILIMLPISSKHNQQKTKFLPIKTFANIVQYNTKSILFVTIAIIIFSLTGATKLIVENSFINYFKPSTQIHQGMKIIDEQLGGTTPLDVIIKFNDIKEVDTPTKKKESSSFGFDEFASEFAEKKDEAQYWFTPEKLELAIKIHDYLEDNDKIGNVQSIATILKIGQSLNDGKQLDSFELALLYNKLPEKFKKIILDPYVNIQSNELRFATRIIDSNPKLRRAELIHTLNTDLAQIVNPKVASYRLSNLMILYNNMLQTLFDSQILTLGLVLGLLFVMFLLIFKSLKIATIAIVANAVPMGVIFGFMGWFNIPLDLMTITIAAISLGIGVDDTIHYLHRFIEELKVDNNYIETMHRSHSSIGYAMFYTSFAIMIGFSILVLSNFTPTIYFGLLTMLVMFMALLGALILLPKLLLIFKPIKN